MRTKVLNMAFLLFIFGTTLSAQEELPPLESVSTVWYAIPVQPASTCSCLTTYSPSAKQELTWAVDVPVSPLWDTVKEERIQNRTIQFGGIATPWKDTVMFGGWPVPRVNFATQNFRFTFEGGVMKTLNVSPFRTMGQVRGGLEGSIWHVLVGTDGFWGQEQIPSAFKGINFDADFRRLSSGGQGWTGVKVGDFNRNFVAVRYGRGYVLTMGEARFVVPSIAELDWFPIYLEGFKTASASIEGKAKLKRVSQSARFEWVEYKRVIQSPDPLRFGENRLQDMWLRTETEVFPFPRARFLRGVVIFTKDFRDQNRLMFINDYSSLRILLRLAFN